MFPQPNSNDPALQGQTQFRLYTQILSPGDIYESEQSCHAIAIGPNSDLNNVNVIYFDPIPKSILDGAGLPVRDESMVGSLVVSPDRPFIGRIDVRMDAPGRYPITGQPGRILFAAADIVDPLWKDANGIAGDGYIYQAIYLDIIQYFQPPSSLTPQRSDRVYSYQYFDEGTDPLVNDAYLVIPAYGRKSGFFSFINRGITPHDVEIIGVNFATTSRTPSGAIQTSVYLGAMAVDGSDEYQYDSSVDGSFDLFALRVANYDQAEPFPTLIRLSDDPL